MAIKVYKPTTQSRRKMSVTDYSLLTKKGPERKLSIALKSKKGRDQKGHISVRHKGGGSKRRFRILTDISNYLELPFKIESIEYDPNRSAFIALAENKKIGKIYLLAWEGIKVGDEIIAQEKVENKIGNCMRIKNIPTGQGIFNLEIQPGQGGKMLRSAGSQGFILSKDEGLVQVKMPSGEIRKFNERCFACIGQASNITHSAVRIGKAGRKRHMGIRPTVRGKAMHPDAHPHGGGEGVNPIGLKYPKTPWGKHAFGVRTRKKNKYSDKFIVHRRKK